MCKNSVDGDMHSHECLLVLTVTALAVMETMACSDRMSMLQVAEKVAAAERREAMREQQRMEREQQREAERLQRQREREEKRARDMERDAKPPTRRKVIL